MRSLTTFFVLLVVFTAPGSLAHAQGTEPASKTDGSVSVAATKEEVNQLRSEVAAQTTAQPRFGPWLTLLRWKPMRCRLTLPARARFI